MSEKLNDFGKGYEAGQEDLYTFAVTIADQMRENGEADDRQWIALLTLQHAMEKLVYYRYKGEQL